MFWTLGLWKLFRLVPTHQKVCALVATKPCNRLSTTDCENHETHRRGYLDPCGQERLLIGKVYEVSIFIIFNFTLKKLSIRQLDNLAEVTERTKTGISVQT